MLSRKHFVRTPGLRKAREIALRGYRQQRRLACAVHNTHAIQKHRTGARDVMRVIVIFTINSTLSTC